MFAFLGGLVGEAFVVGFGYYGLAATLMVMVRNIMPLGCIGKEGVHECIPGFRIIHFML